MRFYGFGDLLGYWATQSPDRVALRGERESYSYADLQRRVLERTKDLQNSGKTCLGLLSDGSPECVIELFAANLAGMQLVLLDEGAPEAVLRGLIAYTDIDMLWGDPELCEELSGNLTQGVSDGARKILFFTSGTTERAKAVVLTEESLCASARARRAAWL